VLEISPEVIGRLKTYCDQRGIVFMSTPYSHSDVDDLVAAGVSSFKLASIHCAEPAFVRFVASKGKPVVLSSGMCTLAEVDRAIAAHLATGNTALALLQCTTDYPSDARDANLLAMQKMGRMFPTVPGYSDHTAGSTVAIAAVALGAKVIERHLTLDTAMPGPDHAASLDPKQFSSYVAALRTTEAALGSDWKQPAAGEVKNKNVMRRCLVLREARPNGHKLVEADFTFMRPLEAGIAVQDLERVAGLQLRRAKGKGEPLTWDDV
jgi:N,N'-diacetyllegionaminate synthase